MLCFSLSSSLSKTIQVKIIDDEEYEKNKNFYLELAEPRMVDMSLQKGKTHTHTHTIYTQRDHILWPSSSFAINLIYFELN